MKFSELQKILNEKYGIDHLADIARELEVSPQAVSNWKARDRVPYKYIYKIRKDSNISTNQNITIKSDTKESTMNQAEEYFEEDTIAFFDIILIVARQLNILLLIPFIFCTVTIFYAFFVAKPIYESTAKIMSSSRSGGNTSQAAGLAAQLGFNLPMNQSEPEWVYPEIIKSRTLARGMLKRKFNTQKYGNQKTLMQILTYGNNNPTFGVDTLEILAINQFIQMIDIFENTQSGIYTLTIRGPEPQFTSELVSALIDELDSHQDEYNKKRTSDTRVFIENRIADTRKELETAEEALKNFSDRNRRIENSPALQLERQRLAREVAVLTGVFTTLKQQLETSKIEEVKESDYVMILDHPEIPLERSSPNRKRMVVLSGILGLGLGFILVFIKEYINNNKLGNQEKVTEVQSLVIKNINYFIPKFIKRIFY